MSSHRRRILHKKIAECLRGLRFDMAYEYLIKAGHRASDSFTLRYYTNALNILQSVGGDKTRIADTLLSLGRACFITGECDR